MAHFTPPVDDPLPQCTQPRPLTSAHIVGVRVLTSLLTDGLPLHPFAVDTGAHLMQDESNHRWRLQGLLIQVQLWPP